MTDKKIIIAIDGYSSSGKSTMAKRLAQETGYRYIDSGAMYRAVALYALRHNLISEDGQVNMEALSAALPSMKIDFAPGENGQVTMLNGEDVELEIRSMIVSNAVSPVAAVPDVRHALTTLQQQFGREKGIVMDGRDIGTTVFPNAEMKVFVTASPETRAHRRYEELKAKHLETPYEEVLANVVERDHLDETRAESPLRKADDAVVLDNSNMSVEEQDRWLMSEFERVISGVK